MSILILLFFASGCSALIFEIVWFQMLELVIGSSTVSLGVLLATFMGGMCLGSIALPRMISARPHPLRIYAALELGIAAYGIVVLLGMPYLPHLYAAAVGQGLPGIPLRGAVSAVCLLPPTLLMGASLPAVARWIETTPQGVSRLGFLYGSNVAGAVFGCLLAGFYLLRVHDVATATWVASTISAAVGCISFVLATVMPHRARSTAATAPIGILPATGSPTTYIAIGLSGLCALGAEVIWTRLLSLALGATVYTLSIILAVFLLGLGIGSMAGSFLSRTRVRPGLLLGYCQILLAAAIAWTAHTLVTSLPYWPDNPSSAANLWLRFLIDLLRCGAAILPPALLWGASFPLALAAAASRGQDSGRLVGSVYTANTAGAIAGALGFSLFLIPWIGTQQSQRLLIGLSAAAAVLVLAPLIRRSRSSSSRAPATDQSPLGRAAALSLAASAGLVIWLAWSLSPVPWELIAYGRSLRTNIHRGSLVYMAEGANASIVVSRLDKARFFHVSGKVEASSQPQDMRMQRMLGHLPALLHPNPRSVLVVGFGTGVTAGSFVSHPGVERIVICEIEPLIPAIVSRYFSRENHDVMNDPRVEIVHDDARHYILTTKERFDVITSDPIHPWVKGTATLYSQEYFELCNSRLNSDGIAAQWVPFYESTPETVKSAIATFFEVFPGGAIWGNELDGEGYDVVLTGRANANMINVDELQQRLERADHAAVAKSLREVDFESAVDLLACYAGRGSDLGPWLKAAEINRDRNLRLQYLAGIGLNYRGSELIYRDLLLERRFPEELFAASSLRKQELRRRVDRPEATR